jgi:mono/diheme cytochrome c family protein
MARVLSVIALSCFLASTAAVMLRAQTAPAAPARTVWNGVFTAAQAERGAQQFGTNCASCHASDLTGGEGPALIGEPFMNSWRESTVDALLEFVRRNMPHSEDGTAEGKLPLNVYQDLVAYILSNNSFPAGQTELTLETAQNVAIQRREGPGELPNSTLARVVGCLERVGTNGWKVAKATRPQRVVRSAGSTTAADRALALGDREVELKFVLTPLTRFVGHRVVASGTLIGEGGSGGINVDNVSSLATTCQ